MNAQSRKVPPPKVVETLIEQPIRKETKINSVAKLQSETLKLIEPVSLPPAISTKTHPRSTEPPQPYSTTVTFSPSQALSLKPSLTFNTTPLAIAQAGRGAAQKNGGRGAGTRKGFGDTDAIGGNRQCTIAFEVGSTLTSIENLEWHDCMNGDIVLEAEQSLYKWVEGLPPSYTNLNPKRGDIIEFTFEQR